MNVMTQTLGRKPVETTSTAEIAETIKEYGVANQNGHAGANNVFVLGVGAQKAGTTWLHQYLSNELKESDFGFSKEYHIFDALHIPECRGFANKRNAIINRWDFKENIGCFLKYGRPLSRRKFLSDIDCYYDFFESILNSNSTTSIVGDITPSYSGLPARVLEEIRDNFDKRDVRVKVIFLMRDPVERCWSAVRMMRRDRSKEDRYFEIGPSEEDELRFYFRSREAQLRSTYNKTIGNIETVFNSEDIFFGFYETLFDEREIRRITSFVGAKFVEPNFDRKINVSKKENRISDDIRREIANHYADVYSFLSDRYGYDYMKTIWSGYKFLV